MRIELFAVAAAVALALTGCTAPQLSTAESCREFNALGASIGDPASMTADSRDKVAGKFATLASNAADSLKDDLKIAADFIDAAMKPSTEAAEFNRMESNFGDASKRISAVCKTVR